MDTHLIVELLAILLLILANGFFALSEFSIIASCKSKLRQNREEGKPWRLGLRNSIASLTNSWPPSRWVSLFSAPRRRFWRRHPGFKAGDFSKDPADRLSRADRLANSRGRRGHTDHCCSGRFRRTGAQVRGPVTPGEIRPPRFTAYLCFRAILLVFRQFA